MTWGDLQPANSESSFRLDSSRPYQFMPETGMRSSRKNKPKSSR